MYKKTKIVATISDARCDVGMIQQLYDEGMNVVRLNTAHQGPEGMKRVIDNVRQVSSHIAILVDTKGPEVRTTACSAPISFAEGDKVCIVGDPTLETTRECIAVSYPDFVKDVPVGAHILIDDGDLGLTVDDRKDGKLYCTIENNATLGARKSVNVPGSRINLPALTEKDKSNIRFAIDYDVDFIAHSFVRSKADILEVRRMLDEADSDIHIIAKIENEEGVDNIDEILNVADGVMVARGDLAVEVGHAAVPALQKRMIRRARELRRFSITATQMMESMITNPVPTRAEVSDVANAVLDGTDAVMCSAETAVGAYPFETVSQMAIICAAAEKEQDSLNGVAEQVDYPEAVSTNLAIAGGAVSVARAVHAKAIVALTESGSTAFEVSRHNITLPIFALTPSISAQRRMAMYRGVRPLILATSTDHDTALNEVEAMLVEHKILSSGDQYIITSGSQMRESGSTNTLEVLRVK